MTKNSVILIIFIALFFANFAMTLNEIAMEQGNIVSRNGNMLLSANDNDDSSNPDPFPRNTVNPLFTSPSQ